MGLLVTCQNKRDYIFSDHLSAWIISAPIIDYSLIAFLTFAALVCSLLSLSVSFPNGWLLHAKCSQNRVKQNKSKQRLPVSLVTDIWTARAGCYSIAVQSCPLPRISRPRFQCRAVHFWADSCRPDCPGRIRRSLAASCSTGASSRSIWCWARRN